MRIGTLNEGFNIYTGITRTGNLSLHFVSQGDFQNGPKVFLSAEEAEKFIAVIDMFLARKNIQNPIVITNAVKGNNIHVMTQNEQLLILLTTTAGNTNIYLSRLQSVALRRFLINWPIYGTVQNLIDTKFRFSSQNPQQPRTNQQPMQQNNYQPQPMNDIPQQPPIQEPIPQQPLQVKNAFVDQPINQNQKINQQTMQKQISPVDTTPDEILDELDELIGG